METSTDRIRKLIAEEEYTDYEIDSEVRIKGLKEPIGQVASFQDNTSGNGEQIYTITPNGTADNPGRWRKSYSSLR